MSYLIPIQYHGKRYPDEIEPYIKEVSGHFDVTELIIDNPISLHTEYSYGKRNFSSNIISNFSTLRNCHKNFVPQLWYSSKWSIEFSKFILSLTNSNSNLKIIEIHPPFNDYCQNIGYFLSRYESFENYITSKLPDVEILIEHRSGSMYKGANFLVSKSNDILNLAELIETKGLKLRIILDTPQLFSAHFNINDISEKKIREILRKLKSCMPYVNCIHIWGKKRNKLGRWNAHIGDLNSFFDNNLVLKKTFLSELYDLLNDGKQRYFVPEVNSKNEDLASIVSDFIDADFKFIY